MVWGGHQNGRIPLDELEYVGVGVRSGQPQYLHPAAAAAWRALVAAVQTRTGRSLLITEGYRTLELQRAYWTRYQSQGRPVAARPGTSRHGWALAVDMAGYGAAELVAVRELGPDLGWSTATGQQVGEPWHLEYVGGLDLPAVVDTALLRRRKEPTMYVRGTTDKTSVYNVYTDANGKPRLRLCGAAETSYAVTGGLVIDGYDSTLTALAAEGQYRAPVLPEVSAPDLTDAVADDIADRLRS